MDPQDARSYVTIESAIRKPMRGIFQFMASLHSLEAFPQIQALINAPRLEKHSPTIQHPLASISIVHSIARSAPVKMEIEPIPFFPSRVAYDPSGPSQTAP
jgi:hypothetical protein